MTALTALWLPILVSAVAVFAVSSIIHMTPLWHKNDYPRYSTRCGPSPFHPVTI